MAGGDHSRNINPDVLFRQFGPQKPSSTVEIDPIRPPLKPIVRPISTDPHRIHQRAAHFRPRASTHGRRRVAAGDERGLHPNHHDPPHAPTTPPHRMLESERVYDSMKRRRSKRGRATLVADRTRTRGRDGRDFWRVRRVAHRSRRHCSLRLWRQVLVRCEGQAVGRAAETEDRVRTERGRQVYDRAL